METNAERFQLVLSTAGSEEQAQTIARELVERRLAACVSVVGSTCSYFMWEGKVTEEGEKLLIIKTQKGLFSRVQETIHELHSYEVPEILAVPILDGDPKYLEWLGSCLSD